MNTNIRCLLRACRELGVACESFHDTQNVVLVDGRHLFVNWATPLIDHAVGRLMLDKDFTWHLLHDYIAMPRTRAYLSPETEPRFRKYLKFQSVSEIADDIERNFAYPLIVKRNSGSHGAHVFRCGERADLPAALDAVFNEKDKDWDYVALAQEWIDSKAEFRVVALDGEAAFAYLKDNSAAEFCGNLSPLHWEGARAVPVRDEGELARLREFMQPIFARIEAPYCGIDVMEDREGRFWLIEINGAPSFEIFVRDNGEDEVVAFFRRVVERLRR